MPDTPRHSSRRIATIASPIASLPGQRESGQSSSPLELLIAITGELAALARSEGLCPTDKGAVLLDVVLKDVRCVLVRQQDTLEVRLSPREQQIARMVASGRTNQAIAAALEISVWTVSTHLRRIFAKLAVSSRAEMVAHLREATELAGILGEHGPDQDTG